MSNLDKAARVIRDHGFDPCREPECIAQDLADAGLLAPDLPEPHKYGGKMVWTIAAPDGFAVSRHDGWVRIFDERGEIFGVSFECARAFGLALLAATSDPATV